jgi:hypothetical protein
MLFCESLITARRKKMEMAKTTDTLTSNSPVSALFAMFYEPARAFAMLEPKRHLWLPMVLLVAAAAVLMTWYFSVVDFAWFLDQVLATVSAAEREQMKSMMGRGFFQISSTFGAVVAYPFLFAVAGLYFMIIGKFINKDISFETGLALSAWSSIPGLLNLPMGIVAILMSSGGQISFSELNPLSLNQLIFNVDMAHPMAGLYDSINLTSIWTAVLTVIGFQAWTKATLASALKVVLSPYVVIYGIWFAYAMSKAA